MAKLYFYYSAMNAGKTTTLLQSNYNYRERGMHTLVLKPKLGDSLGSVVRSRIGLETEAVHVGADDDLIALARAQQLEDGLHCVLVDEAQFLTQQQVRQLTDIVDDLGVSVLSYGLRTDFSDELFEGSQYLLAWADELCEIKTVCHCGCKATMVVRLDADGKTVSSGDQVQIGGNDEYTSVCRTHYKHSVAP